MPLFASHVNAHQRVTLAEEDFNNHVTRMRHSALPANSFPSHTSFPIGFMKKVAMVGGIEVNTGSATRTSPPQG